MGKNLSLRPLSFLKYAGRPNLTVCILHPCAFHFRDFDIITIVSRKTHISKHHSGYNFSAAAAE